VLLVFAADRAVLATVRAELSRQLAAAQLVEVARLDTSDLDDREHFGFRDGISQPIVEGLGRTGPPGNTVRAGEFVLGYRNEYGQYTAGPVVRDTTGRSGGDGFDLGRNGTYLVFRQLRQHVAAFWRFVDDATKNPDGSGDPAARLKLAAKLVGRWPSGAPLAMAPDRDNPELGDASDFGYHKIDPHGFGCPIGAHIRRTNPRDSLDPSPGTDKSLAINKRHRLLRRGREYGPPLPMNDPATADSLGIVEEFETDRGLHFICLNANIGRQFEFVSHTWLNNPNFAGLYDDADPLVAGRSPFGCTFTVQAQPVRQRFSGLPQFVTVRGGAYFFLPGLRAIRYLANLGDS
jgi:Dyp-type peroxidase family